MEGYRPETYGDTWAPIYDDVWSGVLDPAPAVAFLKELAGNGRALELAIGTGRVALPLGAAGVDVSGIDNSDAMVARLKAKPGGEDIPVMMGNFADVEAEGHFLLVYVVFNTLFALTSQEEQVRCFRNVAAHLEPEGSFVIEAFVPDLSRFDRNQRVQANSVAMKEISVETSRHDPVRQAISTQHVVLKDGNIEMYPVFIRYAYPSELDLMAQLAGLELTARYSGWDKGEFTAASTSHVSVYQPT